MTNSHSKPLTGINIVNGFWWSGALHQSSNGINSLWGLCFNDTSLPDYFEKIASLT